MRAKKLLITILRWSGRIFLGALVLFLGLIIYLLVRESLARNKYRQKNYIQVISIRNAQIQLLVVIFL